MKRSREPPSGKSALVAGMLLPIFVAMLYAHFVQKRSPAPSLDYGTGNMFDVIATRYDLVNRLLALNMDMSWRKRMVKELDVSSGDRMLDLATGTADVAILLATDSLERNLKDFTVRGVDPSQNMIDVGKEKVTRAGLDEKVSLEIGDARDLSRVADNSVDKVSMSFGIRNVPEREDVICEIHRVLNKEDGNHSKMAILEFSEPGDDAGVMGIAAKFFIRHVVPVIGAIFSGAPREYLHLQNSIKYFPSPPEFVEMIGKAKCAHGSFTVEQLIQMNFGSVQLYVAVPTTSIN